MKIWRLYLDTSVFGGVFDIREGFDVDSRRVIDSIRAGRAQLLYSSVLEEELENAPTFVRAVFQSIPVLRRSKLEINRAVVDLSRAYLDAGIVGPKWLDDTLHVAAATLGLADAIVSWNFRHIVRLDKIQAFNRVNLTKGHGTITIISPKEVRFDE